MKKTIFYLAILISVKGFSQLATVTKLTHKQKALVSANAAKQPASSSNLKDSTYYSGWNTTNGTWGADGRLVYGYNTLNKEINVVNSYVFNSAWHNNNQTINYVYDVNNNVLVKEGQGWNSGVWENSQKFTSTYDNDNNQLTILTQSWNSATSNYYNFYFSAYTYNSNHKQLTFISQHWDINTAAWVNVESDSTQYNINDEIVGHKYLSWNFNTSSWEDNGKGTNYIYASGDLISFDSQYYDTNTSTYITVEKQSNMYYGNHHLLSTLTKALNPNTLVFDNYSKEDYTYNTFGDQITYLGQNWDTISNSWKNSSRQFDYYSIHTTSVNSLNDSEKNITLFPNPANAYFTIQNNTLAVINEVKVTDISGKICLVNKTATSGSVKIDIGQLVPGMYVVEFKSADSVIYKKLIKE